MHMTFWFSSNLGDFFIDGLTVASSTAFAVTCLVLLLLALGVEGLKMYRAKRAKHLSTLSPALSNERLLQNSETSGLLSGLHFRGKIERMCFILNEVFLYLLQDCINWVIMLAVMGYNGYIFFAILTGAGLGYAIFGESLAHSKIESIKRQLQPKTCGACQVIDESAPGQSDPPSQPFSVSSEQHEVTVHFSAVLDNPISADSQPLSSPD